MGVVFKASDGSYLKPYWLVSDEIVHLLALKYCAPLDINDISILIYCLTLDIDEVSMLIYRPALNCGPRDQNCNVALGYNPGCFRTM